MWGGRVVTGEVLTQMSALNLSLSIQIDENLYLAPINPEPADRVNHSCNPNAGMKGQIGLVAMRAIAPDEEICFDYAMCDTVGYDEFKCRCGEPSCRGMVRADDWKDPDLWERYAGYFSTYVQSRIEQFKLENGLVVK